MISRFAFALVILQSWPAGTPRGVQTTTPADSVRVLRSARSAQRSFESFRRSRLPSGYGYDGPCDVRIGRYCYWRGPESDDTPPDEDVQIIKRREALIRTLDSAAHTIAGDAWVAGQLVRYLVEASRSEDAIRFARDDCKAGVSWCASLLGYAAHLSEKFTLADSAYEQALAGLEPGERCKWMDISELMDDDLERRFKQLNCQDKEKLARRLFWMGSPLYSVGTTVLLTEHLTRVTHIRISENAATVEGTPWSDDNRSLVLRYGWPRWFSRSSEPLTGYETRPSVIGHDAGMPYNFFPSLRALDSLTSVQASDWVLANPQARTGYVLPYARVVHDVSGQIALFRRGDSTLAVAAWDVRRDTMLLGRSIDAALILVSPKDSGAITRASDSKTVGRLSVTGLVDSGLVSLELVSRENRKAARMRLGVPARPSGRIALSDLLLYGSSPDASPVYELEAVRDSALASLSIGGTRAVGVYWETYGLRPGGDPVKFTLTVEPVGVSFLRRAAEALRFADPTSALRVQWSEVPVERHGLAGRGVRVDLSGLRGGRYRLELLVSTDGGEEAVAAREIEVK
ncbi:MAG TPA: hypothetical protein VH559_07515 [Gemmatimonadaceae bacterium]